MNVVAIDRSTTPAWLGVLARHATPRRLVVGVDLTVLLLAYVGAAPFAAPDDYVTVVAVPVWLAALLAHRCYAARRVSRIMDESRRVLRASVSAVVVMAAITYLFGVDLPRAWMLWFAAPAACGLVAGRLLARTVLVAARVRGLWVRRVVLVGTNDEGQQLAAMFEKERWLGYRVVRTLDGDGTSDEVVERVKSTVRETGVNGVVIAATALDLASTNHLIRDLTDAGVHVELSSSLLDISADRLTVRPLGRFPVVYVEPTVRGGWRAVAKRVFDVTVASAVLIATAPLWLVTALLIKLEDRGPVIFSQVRVGKGGTTFRVHKFRSMVVDAEARLAELQARNEADGPLFKMKHDPRITRVGRIIRPTSIDELPQLWNVIKGEMSLVGPRPALPREAEQWDGRLHERLRVAPGVTGMWQVHGRSSASFDDYARLDLYYVDNWSLTQDLAIIARTVPAVLARRGAH